MTAAVLLAAATLLAFSAPRQGSVGQSLMRSPRLAIAVWLSMVAALLAAAAGATVTAPLPLLRHTGGVGELIHRCPQFFVAVGRHPRLLTAAVSGIVGVVALPTVLALSAVRQARHRRAVAAQHLLLLVAAGQAGRKIAVVPYERPAAWCIGGRRGGVVVTEAAVRVLDADELAAVLAHERAHVQGRHHLIGGMMTVVATAVPCRLTRHARDAVSELLEMRADDVAVRRHGRGALTRALLIMSGAPPEGGLAVGGGTTALRRIQRLDDPPARRVRWAASVAALACAAAAVVPLALTAAAARSALGVHFCPVPT